MRVKTLHEDVLVVTSLAWQTSSTLVKREAEAFAIDSPVFPDELDALRQIAAQANFQVAALIATHADWDHLLGSYAFGDVPLGVAENTAERIEREREQIATQLIEFDDEHYIERPSFELPQLQHLPVPGKCELGSDELEIIPTEGHTQDGLAVHIPWAKTLVCGDYLSPVEIPTLSDGDIDAYLRTLKAFEAVLGNVEHVVPGHGKPITAEKASEILEEDRTYLQALATEGEEAALPGDRNTPVQAELHLANVSSVSSWPN